MIGIGYYREFDLMLIAQLIAVLRGSNAAVILEAFDKVAAR